jgi:DNA polymerase-3 subunit gamma/tau
MLTKEAWNAFLKTLEEPPPNTAFVLATTEPQKVMATIVDRCQRFDFQRPSLPQLAEVVRRVAGAESIEIEDGAIALISRAAAGSFRDALGTLDQLVAFAGPEISTATVVEMLGAADAELLFEVTDAVAGGDVRAVLAAVEQLSRSGRDPAQFARDLIAHLRQLLVTSATGEVPDSFTITATEPERLRSQAEGIGEAKLVGAIDALSAAVAAMREGDDPRFSLEVALLRVAEPKLDPSREALLRRIEQLEGQGSGSGSAAEPVDRTEPEAPSDPSPAPPPEANTSASRGASSAGGEAGAEPESVAPTSTVASVELDRVVELWPAVVEHVRESASEMLSSLFDGALPLALDGDGTVLRIGFPSSAKFNKRKAEEQANVRVIAESLQAIVGAPLRPVYELIDPAQVSEQAGAPEQALGEEEIIELLKSKFDASEIEPEAEGGSR